MWGFYSTQHLHAALGAWGEAGVQYNWVPWCQVDLKWSVKCFHLVMWERNAQEQGPQERAQLLQAQVLLHLLA